MFIPHTNGSGKPGRASPTYFAGKRSTSKENREPDTSIAQQFDFEGSPVRMFTIDGGPWFLAADVCRALNMSVTKGVGPTLRVLNADEKRQVSRAQFLSDHPVNFTGWDIEDGSPTIWLISESALYFIALRSQGATKEGTVAYRFRGWLFRDVLPAIRKTGSYSVDPRASGTLSFDPKEAARYVVTVWPGEPPHIRKTAHHKMLDEWSGLDTEILANHMRTIDALWQKTQLVRSVGSDPSGSPLYNRLGKAISDGRRIADECLNGFRQQPD